MVALLLVAATWATFADVGSHGFLIYDDGGYVANNARVQAGVTLANVRWAFTTFDMANWHPLTWLSHMLDCTLYGLDARGHHLTNLWLHAGNAVLLFLTLDAMTGAVARSALVAALFALHPLHVESAAWVAERKDVLSTLFALLTIAAYARWTLRPSAARYAAVLVAFALAAMAKPMVVTLPFVLLLLDAWPLGRCARDTPPRRLVVEKLPLFAIAAMTSVLTVAAQRHAGAIRSMQQLPIADRLANAVVSYATYLVKTVRPVDLACFYPYPESLPRARVAAAAILIAVTSIVALRVRRRSPAVLIGWLWFLGTLVPVVGLVHVGPQANADRYTYLPLIGVFVALVWGSADLLRARGVPAWMGGLAAAVVLAACCGLTRRQVGYWRDDVALFTHALAVNGDDPAIHFALSSGFLRVDRVDEALAHYERAAQLLGPPTNEGSSLATMLERQGWPPARAAEQAANLSGMLGIALWQRGRADAAGALFAETVRLQPARADAHNNLGLARAAQGRDDDALAEFTAALRLQADYADARYNRGDVLARNGRVDEAIAEYRAALQLEPAFGEARNNLAIALERTGDVAGAMAEYEEAIRRVPDFGPPYVNLARLLAAAGRLEDAADRYRAALRLTPDHPEAHFGLGNVLARGGRFADAIGEYRAALAARPEFPEARANLERALAASGRPPD